MMYLCLIVLVRGCCFVFGPVRKQIFLGKHWRGVHRRGMRGTLLSATPAGPVPTLALRHSWHRQCLGLPPPAPAIRRSSSLRGEARTCRASAEEAAKMAEKLGLAHVKRHLFLCADQTKPKCCSKEDSLESWDYLKKRLRELDLVSPSPSGSTEDRAAKEAAFPVMRTKTNCLQVCKAGPVAVCYDEHGATWYHSATPEVLELIIQEHLLGGQPYQPNVLSTNTVNAPSQ